VDPCLNAGRLSLCAQLFGGPAPPALGLSASDMDGVAFGDEPTGDLEAESLAC
jgi:hypothetical protein